jgi:hypothetical protein
MDNKKALLSTDTPKWWDKKPIMTHVRELEDAFGDYLAGNLVDTTSLHKDDVAFGDLLYYLEIIHPRWKGVKVADLVLNKHILFKNLS